MARPSAYGFFRNEAARRTAERLRRRASRERAVCLLLGALGLAGATFWTLRPTATEAALFGFPDRASCRSAERSLAPWFEGELRRMAQTGASRRDAFDPMLAAFGEARLLCAAGRTDEALADLGILANRIAGLEEDRRWTVD